MLNTAGASPRTDEIVPEHQRRVDQIQAQVRAEGGTARPRVFPPEPPRPDSSSDALDHRIAEEIESIRLDLDLLGGTLVCNPVLLERHAKELQSIDRIHQLLGHLARIITAEQKDVAVDQVTLTDLRARLQRRRPGTPA
jgi:hypothetical protein